MDLDRKSFLISLSIHGVLFAAFIIAVFGSGCFAKKPVEIVEFTVAVDPKMLPEPEEEVKEKPQKEPEIKPEEIKKDDIVIEKQKPKEPPKKVEPPKKKEEPKKEKPKKKPIVKGKRITKTTTVPNSEPQRLSEKEIKDLLNKGAKIGAKTSIPKNEVSRYASILMNQLEEAWDAPTKEEMGTRPTVVLFGIANDGTLINPRVKSSSGSPKQDRSCIDAIRRVGKVHGLSRAFIEEHGKNFEMAFKEKK